MTGVFSHWDASDPNFNPGGIWNDVELVKRQALYIKDLSIDTSLLEGDTTIGKIDLKFNIDSLITLDVDLNFSINPRNFQGDTINEKMTIELSPGNNLLEKEIIINNARLWWTHDHGSPHLYDLKIVALIAGKENNIINTFFGIKELELIRNNGWKFFLNKKRIFIKGSNYAPQNHRIANSTREDYKKDIDMMVDANLNMIRVHAHIDREEFHEITSENGILVWQDFPLQWYYRKSILKPAKKQAKRIVSKLKNYPSQGVWCCHNEPFKFPTKNEILKFLIVFIICGVSSFLLGFIFDFNTYLPTILCYFLSFLIALGIYLLISIPLDLIPIAILIYNWNRNVLDVKLAKLVSRIDPNHPVIKASGLLGKSDFHWYDGWYLNKGKYWKANKFSKGFLRRFVPFITEYGSQSFPNLDNFKKFGLSTEWPISDETWNVLKNDFRCQPKILKKVVKTNKSNSLADYIIETQQYQADLLKFYNELWRKNRYNQVGGAICFLFNDCAPLLTWSFVDFWRVPKIAYESVKLSFEPLYALLSKWPRKFKKNSIFKNTILLINDNLEDVNEVKIKIIVKSPTKTIFENNYKFNIKADSILEVAQFEFKIPEETGEYLLKIHMETEYNSIINPYKFIVS